MVLSNCSLSVLVRWNRFVSPIMMALFVLGGCADLKYTYWKVFVFLKNVLMSSFPVFVKSRPLWMVMSRKSTEVSLILYVNLIVS